MHVPYTANLPRGLQGTSTLSRSWKARALVKLRRKIPPELLAQAHEDYLFYLLRERPPDVIHLLGLGVNWIDQSATLMRVRERLGGRLPCPLLFSSWGTDLEIFANDLRWTAAVRRFLGAVDGYIAECDRDERLAREFGFAGRFLGKFPAFGGTDLAELAAFRSACAPSARRLIVVKGRDHKAPGGDPVGRAMTVIRALERCADCLRGYRIVVLQADKLVAAEAELVGTLTGLDIRVMPRLPYADLMRVMGAARAAVAMTVNDGLPSFLVEALALGALPVHSDLEPVREWVEDGVNGLLTSPEDVDGVVDALCRVVDDNDLVDSAAAHNEGLVRERLSAAAIRGRAVHMYEDMAGRKVER